MLDDRHLFFMLRTIARVICKVHYTISPKIIKRSSTPKFVSDFRGASLDWVKWASESIGHYEYLRLLGTACDWEAAFRSEWKLTKKYHDIFEWALNNTPSLEYNPFKGIPIVMPRKYIYGERKSISKDTVMTISVFRCYRRLYQAKINQHLAKYRHYDFLKWTKRKKPEWLDL
jgi:hypothetical protein